LETKGFKKVDLVELVELESHSLLTYWLFQQQRILKKLNRIAAVQVSDTTEAEEYATAGKQK
jgi:hypothetical protein